MPCIYSLQVDLTGDKENILKYCPGLELIEEQHISLSKTVYLREHQLQPFVLAIKNLLSDTKPFTLSFAQIAQLTNEEKTRSFVTLEVGAGYNEVRYTRMLHTIDVYSIHNSCQIA